MGEFHLVMRVHGVLEQYIIEIHVICCVLYDPNATRIHELDWREKGARKLRLITKKTHELILSCKHLFHMPEAPQDTR